VYSAYKNALGPVAYDLLVCCALLIVGFRSHSCSDHHVLVWQCHVVFNGSTGNAVLEEYPPEPNTKDLRAEASTVTTDSIFLCVNRYCMPAMRASCFTQLMLCMPWRCVLHAVMPAASTCRLILTRSISMSSITT